jgi:hypothetical protein
MNIAIAGRPAYLAFPPDFLFAPDPVKARYVIRAWLLMVLPSMALSALVTVLAPGVSHSNAEMTPRVAFLLICLGPLLETLLLAAPLLLLNRLFGPGPAVVASAIFWGGVHSLANWWTHGLIAWWPFLIMAIAFLAWRERGVRTAGLMVWAMHALQNSTVVFFFLVMQLALR